MIDEKNFIIDNKFVSFEEDTPLLRMKQKLEDDKHYREYEEAVLKMDRQELSKNYFKTVTAINNSPELASCITEEKLLDITDEYDSYVFKAKKLNGLYLTKEQYLIRKENIWLCGYFEMCSPPQRGFIYNLHNDKTARYSGNMSEILKQEFKTKWGY